MKQGITLKLKIDVTKEQEVHLRELQEQYRQACQFVSDYYFEQRFEPSRYNLHDALYYEIRSDFGLKAQQAQSVLIAVLARYKTIKTQVSKKRYRHQDKYTGEWHSVKKDLHWLKRPVQFKKPQSDIEWFGCS